MYIARDGCQQNRSALGGVGFLHSRLQEPHRRLHDLRALQDEWELHFSRSEKLADRLHAVQQHFVDDFQRSSTYEGLFQVRLQRFFDAVNDVLSQLIVGAQALERVHAGIDRTHVFESSHELDQRIIRAFAVWRLAQSSFTV